MHWPTDMHAVEIERIEQVEIEEREIADVVDQLRILGAAEARMIGRDDVEMLGQRVEPRLAAPLSPCAPCRNSSGSPLPVRRMLILQPRTSSSAFSVTFVSSW